MTHQALDRVGMGAPGSTTTGVSSRAASSNVSQWPVLVAGKPLVLLADEPTGNLDSSNGVDGNESVRVSCTRDGATICMVTHDTRYLGAAQRAVHLFDGRLVSGEPPHREVA